MNLNDMSGVLPARPVPREQTQALLDQRSAAAGLIKPGDRYTLADRLEQQAREHGERTFLIYGEQRLTYLEVDARANQMAHTFYANGLRAGDVCALAMDNRPAFLHLVRLGQTRRGGRFHQHPGQWPSAAACVANLRRQGVGYR